LSLARLNFRFVNFLVGGELNFFLDAANGVVQVVIFLKLLAELVVAQAEVPDDFTMFREFTQERMMYVHRLFVLSLTVY